MRYVLSVNGRECPVETSEELIRHLESARRDKYAELWLAQQQDAPPKQIEKFAYGLFGANPPQENAAMGTLINGERALLLFEDEDDESFHAFNPGSDESRGEKVDFILSNGQRDEYPAQECLPVEEALRALIFFFEKGEKPDWIHWVSDSR